MLKRSRIAAVAIALAPTAFMTTESAHAVLIRYETSIVDRDGGTFPWRNFLTTEVDPDGEQDLLPTSYINFEVNTETGEISNYLVELGISIRPYRFGNGQVTFAAGTSFEEVDDVSDFGEREILPPFVSQVTGGSSPFTRILFLSDFGTGGEDREFGFLLELEGDLLANTTGGIVNIAPFRPSEPLNENDDRFPIEFGSLNIPLSILGTSRTGSFGVDVDGDIQLAAFGPTESNLNNIVLVGTVIPEPTSLALLATGTLLLTARRRRES